LVLFFKKELLPLLTLMSLAFAGSGQGRPCHPVKTARTPDIQVMTMRNLVPGAEFETTCSVFIDELTLLRCGAYAT